MRLNQPHQGPTMVTLNFTLVLILALNRVLTSPLTLSFVLMSYTAEFLSRKLISLLCPYVADSLIDVDRRKNQSQVYNRDKESMLQLIRNNTLHVLLRFIIYYTFFGGRKMTNTDNLINDKRIKKYLLANVTYIAI